MIESLPLLLLAVPLFTALLIRLAPQRWARLAAAGGALVLVFFYLFLTSLPLDFSAPGGVEWTLWGQPWRLTAGTWLILRLVYLGAGFLYLLAALWPAFAWPLQPALGPATVPSLSPPVVEIVAAGLAALAPLPAALMLPTPLGAVALLLAAVPTVVMLQAAGHADANRAALRYFIFTTLAIPFLLLAGWMVLSEQFVFASIFWRLLLAGLALLLAGFPFHIWVRPLLEVAPSLLLPFFFGLVHLILLAFSFRLLQDNALLEGNRQLYPLLRWIGVATALVGAVLAWKPRATRQLVGALLLIDLGSGIAAVSLGDQGIRPALLLIQSRFLSLLLILSGLSLLHYAVPPASGPGSKFRLPRRVWATALFLYGAISLLGLPLTPGFSGRWALLALMATRSLWPPAILLLAMAGGTAGLLAHLHVLSASRPGDPAPFEPAPLSLRAISLFMLTVAILFALFPSLLISLSARLTQLPS